MITIRLAIHDDLEAITDIYNEAILTTDATFDTEPKTVETQQKWFDNHDARNPNHQYPGNSLRRTSSIFIALRCLLSGRPSLATFTGENLLLRETGGAHPGI